MKVEILEQEVKNNIDFSKVQLLKGNSGTIVLTNGKYSECEFEGVSLNKTELYFSKGWIKCNFKKFEGKITLQND